MQIAMEIRSVFAKKVRFKDFKIDFSFPTTSKKKALPPDITKSVWLGRVGGKN